MLQCMPLITALRKQKQEDFSNFKSSLVYITNFRTAELHNKINFQKIYFQKNQTFYPDMIVYSYSSSYLGGRNSRFAWTQDCYIAQTKHDHDIKKKLFNIRHVLKIRDSRCSSMISHLLSMYKAWSQLPALQKNKNIMLYQYTKGRDRRTAVSTRPAWSIQ